MTVLEVRPERIDDEATDEPGFVPPSRPRLGRFLVAVGVLLGLIALGALLQFVRGAPNVSLGYALSTVFGGQDGSDAAYLVWEVRVPRILLAALSGASLGLAGTLLQGAFRNPVADPGLLGISQAASLVVAVSALMPGVVAVGAVQTACLLFSLATGLVLVFLARSVRDPVRLILIGVILSMFYAMVTSVVLLLAVDFANLSTYMRFTAGSLSAAKWDDLGSVVPWIVVGVPLALLCGRALNVLQLGDELASGLGMKVSSSRFVLLGVAVVLIAPLVTVTGPIGFVALLSPHVARFAIRTSNAHFVLPVAALAGIATVLWADVAGRLLLFPVEVPAGVWTIAVAGPAAIFLARGRLSSAPGT